MARKKSKRQEIIKNPQESMLERFLPLLKAEEVTALFQELEKPAYPSFRINPLKVEQANIAHEWAQRYDWQINPIPFCDSGYWVTKAQFPISKTIEHSLGHYYIQDAASMLPAELFNFNQSDPPLILDMAASPGGKTTHLVSRTNDQALIIANDSSRDRLTALRIVLQNWGSSHVAVTNYPGEFFGQWFPETFDAILLDAPCSMQGLRETESHLIKSITQKEINNLSRRQTKLLESALRAVKVGGQVVYSTCTLTVEENEMVLDQILNHYHHSIQIDPIFDTVKNHSPGLGNFNQYAFNPQVTNAARIWPFSFGTAGFFAARITKINQIETEYKSPPARPLSAAFWNPYPEKQLANLVQGILDLYSINLEKLIEKHNWEIWQFKNSLHCFPNQFLQLFPELPVQSLGLPLAEINGNEFILSHEFITRFGKLAQTNILKIPHDLLKSWFRGDDLAMSLNINAPVQIISDEEQRIIGRGKPSGDRVRNLMPKRTLIPDLLE